MASGLGSIAGFGGFTGQSPNQRIAQGAIGEAQGAGLFSPMGSPLLRLALQRRALRVAEAQRRRGSVLSRLLGLNPNEARSVALDTERDASTNAANALNEADVGFLSSNQDFLRNLLTGRLSAEDAQALARLVAQLQAQTQNLNRPSIGGVLGGALGTGIGGGLGRLIGGGRP